MKGIPRTSGTSSSLPKRGNEGLNRKTWSASDDGVNSEDLAAVAPNQDMRARKRRRLLIALLAFLAVALIVAAVVGTVTGFFEKVFQSASSSKAVTYPTPMPTNEPTAAPSSEPSLVPSMMPSFVPSLQPSSKPSDKPSLAPTMTPSNAPSPEPSSVPSFAPSPEPSSAPSNAPSHTPSTSPTLSPTPMPSSKPTSAPSLSNAPSQLPTTKEIPINPIPRSIPRGYFNYDVNSEWGPNNWYRVDTSEHWLREFGPNGFGPWKGHVDFDPTNNICRSRSKQSPLELSSGNVVCEATHEIRTECANYPLQDSEAFTKLILPHKLSIVMQRRDCLDVTESGFGSDNCDDGKRPPMVDFPKYSSIVSDYSDVHNYDIKVPAEHIINGVQYDAEVQMFLTHLADGRFASIAVPVRATTDGFNSDFQEILNEFQAVYDLHRLECLATSRRLRGDSTLKDWNAYNFTDTLANRNLQLYKGFDPFSYALMPDIFFYRYDGTITEPPCLAITWWVMDSPMLISTSQLSQLRRIMFTHVDSNCQKTSVHNTYQSVARPVQRINTDIQNCGSGSFQSDESKGRHPGRLCRRIRWIPP